MNIEFTGQNTPKQFIDKFASTLEATVKDNTFVLPPTLGEGFMKQFIFFGGFSLTFLDFKIFNSVNFIRKASDTTNLYPIFFYNNKSGLQQSIDLQNKNIGYHTDNGIFMPSPQIETQWEIPANIQNCQLIVTVSKDWLISNFEKTQNSYLQNLLTKDKPFYLFEVLTPQMKRLIDAIHQLIINDTRFLMAKLHGKTMELFTLYLEQIEQRELKTNLLSLNRSDINKIFKVRQQILSALPNKITVVELANDHNMSVRKLQQIFVQVFGKTIRDFTLSEKMNKAKDLLVTKQYSISEIGYSLGYSNLSHFSKAFKRQFGKNPKQYLLK